MTYWVINYTVIKWSLCLTEKQPPPLSWWGEPGGKEITLHLTLNLISRERLPSPPSPRNHQSGNGAWITDHCEGYREARSLGSSWPTCSHPSFQANMPPFGILKLPSLFQCCWEKEHQYSPEQIYTGPSNNRTFIHSTTLTIARRHIPCPFSGS